jgi:hypothetical protein
MAIVAAKDASSSSSVATGGSKIEVTAVDHREMRVCLVVECCGDHTLGVDCVQPLNAATLIAVNSKPMHARCNIADSSKGNRS